MGVLFGWTYGWKGLWKDLLRGKLKNRLTGAIGHGNGLKQFWSVRVTNEETVTAIPLLPLLLIHKEKLGQWGGCSSRISLGFRRGSPASIGRHPGGGVGSEAGSYSLGQHTQSWEAWRDRNGRKRRRGGAARRSCPAGDGFGREGSRSSASEGYVGWYGDLSCLGEIEGGASTPE